MSYTIEELREKTHSYSRLDCFKQCPMKYKFKYIMGLYTDSKTFPLLIGTLSHEVLEDKFKRIMEGNYDFSDLVLKYKNGIKEINPPLEEYKTKVNSLIKRINKEESLGDEWKTFSVEQDINFKIGEYKMIAKIDRMDISDSGDFRVVDYKTNNKLYEKKDLGTPMQFVVYALAIKDKYEKYPVENMYDMIFLNDVQMCLTDKNWEKKGIYKIKKLFEEIELCINIDEFHPKPTPLCWWCPYGDENSPNSDSVYGGICEYRSLWKPNDKTHRKLKEWEGILK